MSPALGYALIWVGFAAYVAILRRAPALGRRSLAALVLAPTAAFAVGPVLLSHDVYSYVDYARLGVLHGLNPYVRPPAAAPHDAAYGLVEWTDATSAYGPLFTLATYPLAWLGVGGAVAALKAAAAASLLGIAALAGRVAAQRGADPRRAVVFVALNPLALVHVAGGAHNDGLAMLATMLGVAAILAAREAAGGAALLAAAAVKLPAALPAPFALLAAWRDTRPAAFALAPTCRDQGRTRSRAGARMALGAAAAAAAIGLAALAAFGWDWLNALGPAGENQDRTSYMSVPVTLARLGGADPGLVRVAAALGLALLLAALLAWTWRGGDWIRAAGWAALGLLLATSWLLPWYLIWLLPLAAVARDRPLQALALALTAFQLTTRIPV